jgi:hypothetical protein
MDLQDCLLVLLYSPTLLLQLMLLCLMLRLKFLQGSLQVMHLCSVTRFLLRKRVVMFLLEGIEGMHQFILLIKQAFSLHNHFVVHLDCFLVLLFEGYFLVAEPRVLVFQDA